METKTETTLESVSKPAKKMTRKEVRKAILGMERRGKTRDFDWFCCMLSDARPLIISRVLEQLVEEHEHLEMHYDEYIM